MFEVVLVQEHIGGKEKVFLFLLVNKVFQKNRFRKTTERSILFAGAELLLSFLCDERWIFSLVAMCLLPFCLEAMGSQGGRMTMLLPVGRGGGDDGRWWSLVVVVVVGGG